MFDKNDSNPHPQQQAPIQSEASSHQKENQAQSVNSDKMEFNRPIIQQINYVNNYNNITTPKVYQNSGVLNDNQFRAVRPMNFMPNNQNTKSSQNSDFENNSFISVNS